ncbi:dihydrolipoamide acetyltransferase family protein [Streptomyces sp. NPDC002055]|uniref:dihydrolipoamide acetyltransferase family protein n=1 Tax=Streptomyces sp. NPDC002055 TaxID=3154534 RepID=UPI0033175A1E
MAVVREFRLPDLGEGLTEAEIIRWLVQVGDVVAVDQPVVEVETAKAMVEVPCPYGGVVTARYGEEGTELPVGAPLLTVAVGADAGTPGGPGPGTSVPGTTPGSAGADSAAPGVGSEGGVDGRAGAGGDEGSGNVLVGYGTGAPVARRRRVRPTGGFSLPSAPAADGPRGGAGGAAVRAAPQQEANVPADGRATTRATSAATTAGGSGPVAVISPLVRRLARENGIDLREVRGSGPEGLILRADVESAARTLTGPPARPAPSHTAPCASGVATATDRGGPEAVRQPATGGAPAAERIPLRGVRGAVADKLSRSRREIPEATCWVDADATELMAARSAMNAAGGPKVSLLALLARICTAALARHPELNSTVDMEAREVVRLPGVHIGFAAQTDRGLVVPVVRDAHTRNAASLSEEFARLTEKARAGTLTPADLTGGTFTLNNYGVFGVDGSTPIINHPEAAMLGVGRIVPKPWVHRGELAVRQVVQLSLTFDHRVCDGGTAGGFLRYVADCVEQPAVLLRTV